MRLRWDLPENPLMRAFVYLTLALGVGVVVAVAEVCR